MMTAAVAGAGRCFGWQPAAKVSTMIMQPPPHRQGHGSMRGWPAAAASGVSGCFEQEGPPSSWRARAILAARLPLANNPADAVQARGQHVHQKAPNELAGWQGHGLISARSLEPIILPREGDIGLVGGDQPAI